MAQQQNGYAIVPHNTYDEFRTYCLTHGVDVDYVYQNQCVDTPKLLWYQYGLTLQTGNGYAYGIWTIMRNQNAKPPFIMITRPEDVKRGDILVFNKHGSFYTGHIAFADENYNGTNNIRTLGQNQGQGIAYGTPSNVVNSTFTWFLGAFRNTNWQVTPPTPTPTETPQKRFPWVLYANKFRKNR